MSNRLKSIIFISVAGVLFFIAWTNRYEHIMGFAYRDRWFGGVVYVNETSSVFTRFGDKLSLFLHQNQEAKRLEQERLQIENDRQRQLNSERAKAEADAKALADKLVQENERNAEQFMQSYKVGQELDVDREALENMIFYARLLQSNKETFVIKGQQLKRSDVASQFIIWRKERKRLLEAELTRLNGERLLAEQKVTQAVKDVLSQRELQERGQHVAAMAQQGRYGTAEVKVLSNDSTDSKDRVNECKSSVDALRQREDIVRQRIALY